MSQYGMQMPGGQLQRGPTMNVYTGLLLAAVIALLAASGAVFYQGQKIGPNGNAFAVHEFNDQTKNYKIELTPDAK